MSYKDTWTKKYSLDEFNVKSHDGAISTEELRQRARGYCGVLFPEGFFGPEDVVLDFGCGVGYIIEELLARFPIGRIVGLGISRPTLELAARRFSHPALEWKTYDGTAIPFKDETFDKVYSTACIQHIEEHTAFLLLSEIMRVLKPGGRAVLHFKLWKGLSKMSAADYRRECEAVVRGEECHWHIYYTREELEIKFLTLLGAAAIDFKGLDSEGTDVVTYVTKGRSGEAPAATKAVPPARAPLRRLPGRALSLLWHEGGASAIDHIRDRFRKRN